MLVTGHLTAPRYSVEVRAKPCQSSRPPPPPRTRSWVNVALSGALVPWRRETAQGGDTRTRVTFPKVSTFFFPSNLQEARSPKARPLGKPRQPRRPQLLPQGAPFCVTVTPDHPTRVSPRLSARPSPPAARPHPRPPCHALLDALLHGPQRQPDSQLRRHAAGSPHSPEDAAGENPRPAEGNFRSLPLPARPNHCAASSHRPPSQWRLAAEAGAILGRSEAIPAESPSAKLVPSRDRDYKQTFFFFFQIVLIFILCVLTVLPSYVCPSYENIGVSPGLGVKAVSHHECGWELKAGPLQQVLLTTDPSL